MSASENEPIDAQVAAIQDIMLDANDALKDYDFQTALAKLKQAERQTGIAMREANE
jgi:hypothetical protein